MGSYHIAETALTTQRKEEIVHRCLYRKSLRPEAYRVRFNITLQEFKMPANIPPPFPAILQNYPLSHFVPRE